MKVLTLVKYFFEVPKTIFFDVYNKNAAPSLKIFIQRHEDDYSSFSIAIKSLNLHVKSPRFTLS